MQFGVDVSDRLLFKLRSVRIDASSRIVEILRTKASNMGVGGLQTFIEKNDLSRQIKIEDEVRLWQNKNPNQTATIIFDILGLCYMDVGGVCGGVSRKFDNSMEKFFAHLKKIGVKLIFIQDLAIETARESVWIGRRNREFEQYVKLYDDIESGNTVTKVLNRLQLETRSENLVAIASKYGDYVYTPAGSDCDQIVAQYANKFNAMSVFSADTDLMIFDGAWCFYTYKDLDFDAFKTKEFDRRGLLRLLSLSYQQLPLLATLIGNDITSIYRDDLFRFHRGLGNWKKKFHNVANYVRRHMRDRTLTQNDIDIIVFDVFGERIGDVERQLNRNSYDSYDLNLQPLEMFEIDLIEEKLGAISAKSVRSYRKLNVNAAISILITFFDMLEGQCTTKIVDFLIEITRKKMGIVYSEAPDGTTFRFLTKKTHAKNYAPFNEPIIKPGYSLPALVEFLTGDDKNDELNDIRWNVLAWMLSISDEQRDNLRAMDVDFRVPCATLLAMVQRGILSVTAADGILVTEMAIKTHQAATRVPQTLNVRYVRASHLYRVFHAEISQVFTAAGLTASISDFLRFDGIYYHNIMLTQKWSQSLNGAIQPYRIYAKAN